VSINASIVYNAQMSAAAGSIAAGQVVTLDPTTGAYVPATAAARAAAGGIVSGVALTAASSTVQGFTLLLDGAEIAPDVSGLGAGAASPVIVGATGYLERKASPVYGTDAIVGDAYADGTVVLHVGRSQKVPDNVPTGTGFPHVTAGVQDAAAKLVENADVAAGAGIAVSKLAAGAAGTVLRGAGPAYGAIVNADVDAAAAIDGTKINPNFGAQNISTTGDIGASGLVNGGRGNFGHTNIGTNDGPITGTTTVQSPWSGLNGYALVDMADNPYTLTAAEYAMSAIEAGVTPLTGANKTLTFPAPADDVRAYWKWVRNADAVFDINVSTGAGSIVILTAGFGALILFTTAGARQMAPQV
jgi:hypothetical protein